jgi:hypothetical protein
MSGQWQLDQDAVHAVIGIEPCDQGKQFVLAGIGGQNVLEARHAQLPGHLALTAHVNLAGRIGTDEHDGKPRHLPRLPGQVRNATGDLLTQHAGIGFAVDSPSTHLVTRIGYDRAFGAKPALVTA